MKKTIIRKHFAIILSGIVHALKGALAVCGIAAAVRLYCYVPKAVGFLAVGSFAAATLAVIASIALFYWCGLDLASGGSRFSD